MSDERVKKFESYLRQDRIRCKVKAKECRDAASLATIIEAWEGAAVACTEHLEKLRELFPELKEADGDRTQA